MARALWAVGTPAIDPLITNYVRRKAVEIKTGKVDSDLVVSEFTLGHESMAGIALLRLERMLDKAQWWRPRDETEVEAIGALLDAVRNAEGRRRR